MKYSKSILLTSWIFLVIACNPIDEFEHPAPEGPIPEAQLLHAAEVDLAEREPNTIAIIKKDGYELYFDAIDEGEGGMVIREKIPFDKEQAASMQERLGDATPLELFLHLTDKHVAVPLALSKMAEPGSVQSSGREIDSSGEIIRFEAKPTSASIEKACYDLGSNGFRNSYCGNVVASTNQDIRFCDSGTWTSHIRNSVFGGYWMGLNKISTATNVLCGPVTMKFLRYEWWVGGVLNPQWLSYYQVSLPNGIWIINSHNPPSYTKGNYKKVTRVASNGSFRAYTRFFSIY